MDNLPRLTTFGDLRLTVGPDRLELPAKSVAVILYLAHYQGALHPRAEVATLLWPDVGLRNARHSLSQALYRIKKELGADLISTTSDAISIESISADFGDFQAAVDRKNWKRAASQYQGLFAQGFSLPETVEFEHWLDARRADYEKAAQEVASQLVSGEQWQEALSLAEVLLADGIENPRMARVKALGLLATSGRRAAFEFADELTGESALHAAQAISNSSALGPERSTTAREHFVGRTEAMAWLQNNFEEALSGSPVLALVQGEAGSGKSSLIGRFSRLMTIRGARILSARAYQAEQNIPFGVATQWVRDLTAEELETLSEQPWMRAVSRFFPHAGASFGIQPSSGIGQIGHQRLLESLRRLIAHVADARPLILVLDDIHLTDSATLAFVHYLLRHSADSPLLLVATIRLDKGRSPAEVRGWDNVTQLTLDGLSRTEVAEYLERVSHDLPAEFETDLLDHLYRQTGGNPLLLSTLIREESYGSGTASGPPASIVEFFRPRLLQQPHSSRRLLAALAILPDPCPVSTLSELGGTPDDETRQVVAALENSHLIIQERGKVRLRHGLVGEVALSLLGESDKQRLHGRAARILARSATRSSSLMAMSHDLAGNRQEAFEASRRASLACDVLHARKEKEFFLKLALSNAPSDVLKAEVRVELAELHLKQRQLASALELLDVDEVPASATDIRQRTQVLRVRVLAEMTGDVEALRSLWVEAREAADSLPPLFVADTYTHIGGVAWDLGLDELAAEVAELVIDRLSTLPSSEATALRALRPTAAIGVLRGYEDALEQVSSLPKPSGQNPVYTTTFSYAKATLLVAAGRLLDAEALFARSLGLTERLALFDHVHAINNNLGVCLMEQGRYGEAEVHFAEAREHAAPTSPSQHSTSHDNLTILAYERGDSPGALEAATDLLSSRKVSGGRAVMSLFAIMGLSALEVGDLSRCRQAENELRILMERYGGYSNDMSYAHVFLARMAAIRKDHHSAIGSLAEAAQHFRSRNLLAHLRLEIERCRLMMKDGSDCSALLDQILEDLEGSGAVPLIERAEGLRARSAPGRA